MPALLAELRRRGVIKVGATYVVVAWLLVQGASIAFPAFGAPPWVLRVTIFLLVAGLFLSVGLAWAYRVQSESGGGAALDAPAAPRGFAWGWTIALGAAAIIAAALLAWRQQPPEAETSPGAPIHLAVLPFANLSGDESQEYFSEGMTEEISGKLAAISGLAVTARTSAAKYKNSDLDAREIGRALGVRYLVEGSVRRAGDRIRVKAALVDATTALQVWSDDIDVTFEEVLSAQDQVAEHIVDALGISLTRKQKRTLVDWGTRNALAYDEYLRGRFLVVYTDTRSRLDAAAGHFEKALSADPAFAPAIAGLAEVEAQIYRNFDSDRAHIERARALIARALALDPDSTAIRSSEGLIRAFQGDYAYAAKVHREIVADEPQNFRAWDNLCWALGYVEPPRSAEAEQACKRALAINPAFIEAYYHLSRVLVQQGRYREAEQALEQLREFSPDSPRIGAGYFWLYMGMGRPRDALRVVSSEGPPTSQNLNHAWSAMALAQAGDLEAAFSHLERALEQGYRDGDVLARSPYFAPLRSDPRFDAMLRKFGLGN